MKHSLLLISTVMLATSLIIVIGCAQNRSRAAITDTKSETGVVVMELFTSQGCSSCPPADEILGQYALKNDTHIIPLAFHVDYWNRLGWTDSFSTAKYTNRQRNYAAKFGGESVYTPQIVLNGQKEILGSDDAAITANVSNFLKEPELVSVSIANKAVQGSTITVSYTINKSVTKASINAALVQANVITYIKAGENRGMKLDNYNIVRDFETVVLTNTTGNIELQLPPGNSATGFSIVLFAQDDESGKILGAIKAKL